MSIGAIPPVTMPAFPQLTPPSPVAVPTVPGPGSLAPASVPGAGGSPGADFGSALAQGLEKVQAAQTSSDQLATKAATGSLTDVHDYMIASTEASLATEMTVAVRNKAVEAFNEIMRMPA